MKKIIKIEAVELEGFRSYVEPTYFKFESKGMFRISGPIGVGKTSLFEAVSWAAYKINLKGTSANNVVSWKHVRPKKFNGTRVILYFRNKEMQYAVARHIKYTQKTFGVTPNDSLMVFAKPVSKEPFTDKHLVGDELYNGDAQTYVEGLLGINADTFLSSILMGQGMNRLLASKTATIRELFEVLFDTSWVDELKSKADIKLQTLGIEYAKAQSSKLNLTDKLNLQTARYEQNLELSNNYTETKKAKMQSIKENAQLEKDKLEGFKESLAAFEEKIAKQEEAKGLTEIKAEYEIVKESRRKAEVDWHVKEQEFTKADVAQAQRVKDNAKLWENIGNIQTVCPTCSAKIDPSQVAEIKRKLEEDIARNVKEQRAGELQLNEMQKEIEKLQGLYNKEDVRFSTVAEKLVALRNQDEELQKNQNIINSFHTNIALQQQKVKTYAEQFNTLKNEEKPDYKLEEIQKNLETIRQELDFITTSSDAKAKEIASIEWWNKKAFNAGGMKNYIFSAMMGPLNEAVSDYAAPFGFGVKFWIDTSKASKPFNCTVFEGEHELEYADLSGGQRGLLNLAMAFAMYDIVNKDVAVNILMLDEPFDSLDVESINMLTETLKKRSLSRAVYLVAHNPIIVVDGAVELEVSGGNVRKPTVIS